MTISTFEHYHPYATPHLVWDWLTRFSLKQVTDFRYTHNEISTNLDYSDTAHYIQQTMLAIMRNQQLVWGLGLQSDFPHTLVASLTLLPVSTSIKTAQVRLLIDPYYFDLVSEITLRLHAIIHDQFHYSSYELIIPLTHDSHLLTQLGFNQARPHHYYYHWKN